MVEIFKRTNYVASLNRRKLGSYYEHIACQYLQAQGLTFIAANVQCHHDEIDLIMQDNGCWVFVEVRFRKNAYFGDSASTVTVKKQQKLLRAASYWFYKQEINENSVAFRFDVFAITGNDQHWIRHAF